jgi:hypothetical protein
MVVTLRNVTVADFESDVGNIRSDFIKAVAASANVSVSQVTITGYTLHTPVLGGGHRMLPQDPKLDIAFDVHGSDSVSVAELRTRHKLPLYSWRRQLPADAKPLRHSGQR